DAGHRPDPRGTGAPRDRRPGHPAAVLRALDGQHDHPARERPLRVSAHPAGTTPATPRPESSRRPPRGQTPRGHKPRDPAPPGVPAPRPRRGFILIAGLVVALVA